MFKCISTEFYLATPYECSVLEPAGLPTNGMEVTTTFSKSPKDAWNGVGGNTVVTGSNELQPILGEKQLFKNGKLIKETF